jgi:long-subunit acyl-CoA synthetase (AMP-forming)
MHEHVSFHIRYSRRHATFWVGAKKLVIRAHIYASVLPIGHVYTCTNCIDQYFTSVSIYSSYLLLVSQIAILRPTFAVNVEKILPLITVKIYLACLYQLYGKLSLIHCSINVKRERQTGGVWRFAEYAKLKLHNNANPNLVIDQVRTFC